MKRNNLKTKFPKLKIKRGDQVKVISGKERGSQGKVLRIDSLKMRVWIQGLNLQTKHMKPNQQNQSGGIIKKEGPIHYSNVLLYCSESDRGERIKIQLNKEGLKQRFFTKSGIIVD